MAVAVTNVAAADTMAVAVTMIVGAAAVATKVAAAVTMAVAITMVAGAAIMQACDWVMIKKLKMTKNVTLDRIY